MAKRPTGLRINGITKRRIFSGLAAMVALLVLGTIIGLIWADTSDVAGAFAVVTNIDAANAERGESVLVLEPPELPLHGSAPTVD